MLVDQKSALSDNHMKVDISNNSVLIVLLSWILCIFPYSTSV